MRLRIRDGVESVICPTIMAHDAQEFRMQMKRASGLAQRVHIDISDGAFVHARLAPIKDIWWPEDIEADIHMLYKDPLGHMEQVLELKPRTVVVHAEADGNFSEFAKLARRKNVAVGIALRPQTPLALIEAALDDIDHVLILSGYLGQLGGYANTHLLTKVLRLARLSPGMEIGWEGGINDKSIAMLAASGVDVFNVGGFIQHADDAQAAYKVLESALQSLSSKHKQI